MKKHLFLLLQKCIQHKQMHEVGSDGNVYSRQAQAASLSLEPVLSVHCLAALDLGAGVEQPFDCLVQAVQSIGRSMDWTLEDNMVDSLFCATPTKEAIPYLYKQDRKRLTSVRGG